MIIELLKNMFVGTALVCGILFLLFLALLLFTMIVQLWKQK